MPRKKLLRYNYRMSEDSIIPWLENPHILFPDAKNIVVEIACGRGEYTVGMAPLQPDVLHVGIDQKGDRISVGMQKAQALWLQNVRFIYGIVHHMEKRFFPKSIDALWIIHPDPRPRERDAKRRLTHPRFLTSFEKLLKEGGTIHFKTDAHDLFKYSCEQLEKMWWECLRQTNDLHQDPMMLAEHHGIRTHYEKLGVLQGRSICYGVWRKCV